MLTQSSVALIKGRIRTKVVSFQLHLEGNPREDASFPNKHNTHKTIENMQNVFTRILQFLVLSIFAHKKCCFASNFSSSNRRHIGLRRAELKRERLKKGVRERESKRHRQRD